jgi:hypothetical protein
MARITPCVVILASTYGTHISAVAVEISVSACSSGVYFTIATPMLVLRCYRIRRRQAARNAG